MSKNLAMLFDVTPANKGGPISELEDICMGQHVIPQVNDGDLWRHRADCDVILIDHLQYAWSMVFSSML